MKSSETVFVSPSSAGAPRRHRARLRGSGAATLDAAAAACAAVVGQDPAVWREDLLPRVGDPWPGLDALLDEGPPRDRRRPDTSPAASAIFDLLDVDRDGTVTRDEFDEAVVEINRLPGARRVDVESTWALLDCDGDGHLERDELERGLGIAA